MRYRLLFEQNGVSGPELPVIAFGCWPMGGWLWSGNDDEQSIQAVRRAVDLGITFFDNADCYGFGHAETLLARALGPRIRECFIATKGGVEKIGEENGQAKTRINVTRDYLLAACEASLKRLGVECIDLYQVHWPNVSTPVEETMDALNRLRTQGKVRYVGVSNYSGARIEESLQYGPLHTNQPPYNLLQREMEADAGAVCLRHGMGILAYGPLCQGLLTGKYTRDNIRFPEGDHRNHHKQFREPLLSQNLRIIERLTPLARAAGRSLAELAVAWVLARGEHVFALCGAKRPEQIEETAKAADWVLTESEVAEIDQIVAEERAR